MADRRPTIPRRVLVVDDELAARAAVSRMVNGMGYPVRSCRGGKEALGYLKRHPAEVRLLLTDVTMPAMDGGELAERALAAAPKVKIILMAEPADGAAQGLVRAYPECPVLEKPVAFTALLELLSQHLGPPENLHPRQPPTGARWQRRRERSE
jgi:two-component system cell cycle sensor histidine kinase/response regulator CckA